ncbi:FecR family protein [Sphingobacterium siyangense]|uniref:FecR family protein n=1 Tax=Sphingobacterium siyangense TaxID=459529 RepID=A0A562MZZ1_9SPHI|nr:FecR family protein [Sphingobacterium siyangense]TWI25499.1 FecR family protein [Sphingobacterium siyangense]
MVDHNQFRIKQLAYKWLQGTCTPEEEAELQQWYETSNGEPLPIPEELATDEQQLKELLFLHIKQEIQASKIKRIPQWVKLSGIAAALALLFILPLYLVKRTTGDTPQVAVKTQQQVHPGIKAAVLTLADGTKIDLSAHQQSVLHQDEQVKVVTTASGTVQYQFTASKNTAAIRTNTIETPIGTEYTIILADGSKVWLNAGSVLTFPESFASNSREVKLSGEAYFEVSHDSKRPFYVRSNEQTIRVFGTHFNVSSYPNENNKTTLIAGSVQVSQFGKSKMLKPGQAAFTSGGNLIVAEANIEEAMAWKNGFFYFESTPIKDALAAIKRWYNVDIVYKGTNEKRELTGKIKRNSTAQQLVETLNFLDIKCRLQNNKIEVEL